MAKDSNYIKIKRGDEKYLRIESYKLHEINLGLLYEALLRLNKAYPPEQYHELKIQYDIEYHIESIINKSKSLRRYYEREFSQNRLSQSKDLMNNYKIISKNLEDDKQYFINILEGLAEDKFNDTTWKSNTFGIIKSNISKFIDAIKEKFEIYESGNSNNITYLVLQLFQSELTIIPEENFSHFGISALQKYDQRVLVEINPSQPVSIQLQYLEEKIKSLHKDSKNNILNSFLSEVHNDIAMKQSKKLNIETKQGNIYIDYNKDRKGIQKKIADMFFIYDALKDGAKDIDIVGSKNSLKLTGALSSYYQDIIYDNEELKYLNISRDTYNKYKKNIKKFMKAIELDYKDFDLIALANPSVKN